MDFFQAIHRLKRGMGNSLSGQLGSVADRPPPIRPLAASGQGSGARSWPRASGPCRATGPPGWAPCPGSPPQVPPKSPLFGRAENSMWPRFCCCWFCLLLLCFFLFGGSVKLFEDSTTPKLGRFEKRTPKDAEHFRGSRRHTHEPPVNWEVKDSSMLCKPCLHLIDLANLQIKHKM